MHSQIRIHFSKKAAKQTERIPTTILESLRYWIETVEMIGIQETRKLRGYHDEPLKGDRKGQRSIRLNKAYRAIYIETKRGLEILILEVTNHEY